MENIQKIAILLCTTSSCLATTWIVDDDGKADFTSIQEAINVSSDGDVVYVRSGTYYESIDFLGKWIQVQGEDQHNTIIDAAGTNAPVVTFKNDESAFSVLSTFTLRNGTGAYWVDPIFGQQKCGGGIFCDTASPFIELCTIKENIAWGGGGIFVTSGEPYIFFCDITSNVAEGHGGGMYIIDQVHANIDSCNVQGNTASWGGGMTCTGASDSLILNSSFNENTTHNVGGGLYIRSSSSPIVTNCEFNDNMQISNPLGSGGGICIYGGGSEGGPCFPTITDCSFEGNTVQGDGGGLAAAYSGHPKLTNCTFDNNHAGRSGGGLSAVADSDHIYTSTPDVQYCSFTNNFAEEEGGGIHARYSDPILLSVEVLGNTANNVGGGINFFDSPDATMANSTVCGNTPNAIEGAYIDYGGNTVGDGCVVCEGDTNGDGVVDVTDLLAAVGSWGPCQGCDVDIDGNGVVDVTDLLLIVGNWGDC
ncbi:MAG: hypothetical protein ISR75_02075 [Phycisphaerales bacterium]|nr:hypothetical protein [Phycisphaerales bacterium]